MSVFEVLASDDAAQQERIAGTRAVIVMEERVKEQFEKFVSKARNTQDRSVRFAMIEDEIRKIASEVAEEYEFTDEGKLYYAANVVLCGGHASDCSCGFCANKGNLPGSKKEKTEEGEKGDDGDEGGEYRDKGKDGEEEAKKPWEKDSSTNCDCACENCKSGAHCSNTECVESKHSGHPGNGEVKEGKQVRQTTANAAVFDWAKVAADVETGDTYVTEREALPSADSSGLGDTGAVPTDKSRVPATGLKPIDVPSKMHPLEQQGIHETPDYGKELPGPSQTGTSQDVSTKSGPDSGDATKTWTGTEGLAAPVTSRAAKWAVTE